MARKIVMLSPAVVFIGVIAALVLSGAGGAEDNVSANAGISLTVNGLDATVPVKIEGKDELVISVAGADEGNEQSYSVICGDRGRLEPVSGPNEVNATAYRFVFDEDWEFGTVLLVTDQNMVIDGIAVTAGMEVYKLFLFYSLQADASSVIGIDFESLSWVAPEPQAEQAAVSEDSISGSEAQLELVDESQGREIKREQNLKNCSITARLKTTEEKPFGKYTYSLNKDKAGQITTLGYVEIPAEITITSNTIWDSDVHLNGKVYIENAMLVIMPGVTVWNSAEGGIIVRSGGVIRAKGVPGNRIVFISDAQASWTDYDFAIKIEKTASSACKISYCDIVYARRGIWILNNRLDFPIEDNEVWDCNDGIVEEGPMLTNVLNNQVIGSWDDGIEVSLADSNGVATIAAEILIENNLINGNQDYGITVWGVADANDAGKVVMANNLIVGSYWYAVCQLGGWMEAYRICNGYYANYAIENPENAWDDISPVILTEDPFVYGRLLYPFFIEQDCELVDAGYQYVEETHLIGKTTDVDELPDCNYVDIGFHYPAWSFSNPGSGESLSADLDDDMDVDFEDFAILANGWGTTYDIDDLNAMAEQWLKLADPNIQIHTYGDSNDGYIDIGVSGWSSDTLRIFLLENGTYVREIFSFRDGKTLTMDISDSGNEVRDLKAVSVSSAGSLTCSNIKEVSFPCPLNYCVLPETYEPNEPLYFSAFNPTAGDVSVKVYADGGAEVWSQSYAGTSIFDSIPAAITRGYEFDYISFDKSGGGWSITKIADPAEPDFSFDVKALIILPNLGIRLCDFRTIWAVQAAFKDRGIKYKRLGGKSANYDMIAWYATTNPIKYIYIGAHGGYQLGGTGVLRTYVVLSDGRTVSMKKSDFIDPNSAPSWCTSLGNYWEKRAKSFLSMGFYPLEFAYFDCCYSGHLKINANNQLVKGQPGQIAIFDGPHSDMSLALGMGETSISRVYQGWYNAVPVGLPWPLPEDEYRKWTRLEWEELGDGESLYWTLMHVIGQQTEFGPDDPVNNYRLKGQGYLFDIELSGN